MSKKPSAASSSAPPPRRSTSDDDDDSGDEGAAKAGPYRTDPKGDELVQQAEKKMKSFSLFGGNKKYEDGIEILTKAAAQYKMNKNWQEAGDCYVKCADLYANKLNEAHDAGTNYELAAKAYKNVNTRDALRCYQQSVEILMENNRFASAAKIWKEIGTISEKDHDLKGAMEAFQKAADCYDTDNASANANGMHVKVAALAAESGDYKKAIEIYERVAKNSLDNSSLKWSVKDYLFRALLCQFVLCARKGQLSPVESKLDKYSEMCTMLEGTREQKLIQDLIVDFNERDVDNFSDHVFRFDEILKLDNWTAKVLLEIKNCLEKGGDDDDLQLQ